MLLDKVCHRDPGRLIDIVNPRRNPCLRCDVHGDILVWIAERTCGTLHTQEVATVAGFDPKGRCTRGSARNWRDRADFGRAQDGNER